MGALRAVWVLGVEHLEGEHGGVVGIGPEPAHGGERAAVEVVAGVGVLAPSAHQGEAVERPEAGLVGVVAPVELGPGRVGADVVDGGDFEVEQCRQRVAQADEGPQLGGVLGRLGRERLGRAVEDPGEASGDGGDDAAFLAGTGLRRRRGPGVPGPGLLRRRSPAETLGSGLLDDGA